jgi:hypothetical protein
MNKKIIIVSLFVVCAGVLLFFIFQKKNRGRDSINNSEKINTENIKLSEKVEVVSNIPPIENKINDKGENSQIVKKSELDKIEVFLFHSTQRCISCINIGKYAKQTIDNNFSEELKSGKIVFREINIDLSENKTLAEKFQASGSALFINTIRNGKDDIGQDSTVWRLVGNETDFETYFKRKLKDILSN